MSTLNFNGLCRSCLSSKNFLSISFDTRKYREVYSEFIPHVSEFSIGMCTLCFRHLQNAVRFREQCIRSEETLRNIQKSAPGDDELKSGLLEDAVTGRRHRSVTSSVMSRSSTLLIDSTEQNDHLLYEESQQSHALCSVYVLSRAWSIKRLNKTDKKTKINPSKRLKKHESDHSEHFSSEDDSTVLEYITKSSKGAADTDHIYNTQIKNEPDDTHSGLEDIVNGNETESHDSYRNSTTRCSQRSHNRNFAQKENLRMARKHKTKKTIRENVNTNAHDPSIATMITLTEAEATRKMDQIRRSSQFKCAEHKCASCAIVFSSQYLQNEHVLKFHSNESQPFRCHLCAKRFSEIAAMRRHVSKHLQKYKCKICSRILSDWQAAKIHHERSHDTIGDHICNVCKKYFKNKRILNLHLKVHDTTKSFACVHCPRVYAMKAQLVDHMSSHTGVKLYGCPVCSKSFARRSAMIHHSILHDERARRRYRCEECGLSYASRGKLNEHLRVGARHLQPDSLRFECDGCSCRFLYASELRTHMALKHGNHESQKKFVCDACGKSFSAFRTLKIHKVRNHKIGVVAEVAKEPALRRFRCRACMTTFYSEKELAAHKSNCLPSGNVSSNGNAAKKNIRGPRKCPLCQKLLTTSAGLKMHMFCHSGDRPFVCSECGRRFTQPGNLKRHIRVRHLAYVLGG